VWTFLGPANFINDDANAFTTVLRVATKFGRHRIGFDDQRNAKSVEPRFAIVEPEVPPFRSEAGIRAVSMGTGDWLRISRGIFDLKIDGRLPAQPSCRTIWHVDFLGWTNAR